jgi:hypothetical protein
MLENERTLSEYDVSDNTSIVIMMQKQARAHNEGNI